ncbi:MAG: SGNH/GDSL hydrolase family protein [Chloroflexi bacterium]|nr:SGNH/GDSL hydrolase family protein [Chloroflexota bacterium]
MTRRISVLLAALAALCGVIFLPTSPAGASHARAVDPAQLALPASALPADAVVVHNAVSDNADADGAPSPDGNNNDIKQLHQKSYTALGRITGWRERFHFTVQGQTVTTQYLASVFASPDQARAALDDATNSGSIIALIGTALSPGCTAGDACAAFTGVNGSSQIIYTAFVRGPVLMEFASAVDAGAWKQMGSAVQTALYSLLGAADARVQQALGGTGGGPTSTPAPTATPVPTASPMPVPARTLGSYYLALGDSFAAGYLTSLSPPPDIQCKAADAPGFVCIFWRYLKQINPRLQLNNLADPGADSCELAGAGHRCYDDTPRPSPVDAAVQYLKDHAGQVSPITLTIGGNDLLALLPAVLKDPSGTVAMLPGVYKRFQANYDLILSRLRGAAPNATIIVTTQPNSLGGLTAPPLPAGLPELAKAAIDRLNGIMKDEAAKYGAIVADSAAAFDAAPGGASNLTWVPVFLPQQRLEIHPTPQGYIVYADAVIKASGYVVPLKVSARLAKKQVARGRRETVTGTTVASASLSIKVWTPKRKVRTVSGAAGADGSFRQSFKVGTVSGSGAVQVCAADDSNRTVCTRRLSFAVR